MKVDAKLVVSGLDGLREQARDREATGYDAVWSAESRRDPFLALMPVAEHSERLRMGTAIAVAFARTPMSMAYLAQDLQLYSGGRLLLGLGSQVKPHIERRFGMPWSHPAARMLEYIAALRAIWANWNEGAALDFRGDFYQHTLMVPFFAPDPSPTGPPPVYLAAVGDRMTEVAGEVADGLMPHPFTTERYLRERTLPALERGLARSGRSFEGFSVSLSGFVVSGRTEEEMTAAALGVREQLAFYGSTPSYKPVLELHGWGELADELHRLSRSAEADRWSRMAGLIDDEVLAAFAVVAEPDRIGDALLERFGAVVDRFNFYAPYRHDEEIWRPAVERLRAAG